MRAPTLQRVIGAMALALAALVISFSVPQTASAAPRGGSIGRGEVMDRAWSWIAEQVPYSQSGCHENQFGCYRPDCSGYVSMAWRLDSSLTTWTLWNVTSDIPANELQPGDALLRDSGGTDHVALFVRWADEAHTRPVVRETYDFGHVPEERVWNDGLRGFTPRRYDQLDDLMPYGSIGAKFAALGGAGGPLGEPVAGERDSMMGGRFQAFRNGIVIWHPDAAFAVYGDILTRFWATDAERRWGFPATDEADAGQSPGGSRGRYQFFEKALFLWSPQTGAHPVQGAVYEAFRTGGNERVFGYPVTDETDEAGNGKAQKFQNATIHWNPARGTWTTND
ncbi:LGFP repeat-containing protein [Streptomyces sp. NPDC059564]|uniref:LGFP repeat-containing protein n=1 Tax=Streptomyces sp. NPDC059564 TaxID=3346865 RepID=UPI0036C48697